MLHPQTTLNCRGRLLSLERPLVMGILNITPDSFYTGSRIMDVRATVERAGRMLAAGAAILDIGGMSSRPGAEVIAPDMEWARIQPVIEAILEAFPEAILSIDTVHPTVARRAVVAGVRLINDISAGRIDPEMYATVAALRVPYILMHMRGRPETMAEEARKGYTDLLTEIWDFLAAEVGRLRELGVIDIIIDPGFGFGKTIAHNFELLRHLHAFRTFDLPLLAGLSRKSMIWRTLGITPEAALNGTTALNLVALQQGANILRVHDVREAVEVVDLFWRMEHGE